jgi:hypothetical protein
MWWDEDFDGILWMCGVVANWEGFLCLGREVVEALMVAIDVGVVCA